MKKLNEWNASYLRNENFLFYPHEEVIRFASKYIRRRIGVDLYEDKNFCIGQKSLDVGCGIGRHAFYLASLGFDSYGIDLSDQAIDVARKISCDKVINSNEMDSSKFIVSGIDLMPFESGFFDYAVSHGVLDSMPTEVAILGCKEISRVLKPQALFYCDVISGDATGFSREYSGESIVSTVHEQNTVQSYFNYEKLLKVFCDFFEIVECNLIKREDVGNGGYTSRYHLVLKNKVQ